MTRLSKVAVMCASLAAGFGDAATCNSAWASGPLPDMQRLAEMAAAGESASARLGRKPVDAIEYLGPDRFRVRIGQCWIAVRLADAPPPTPPSGRPVVATAGEPHCSPIQ